MLFTFESPQIHYMYFTFDIQVTVHRDKFL